MIDLRLFGLISEHLKENNIFVHTSVQWKEIKHFSVTCHRSDFLKLKIDFSFDALSQIISRTIWVRIRVDLEFLVIQITELTNSFPCSCLLHKDSFHASINITISFLTYLQSHIQYTSNSNQHSTLIQSDDHLASVYLNDYSNHVLSLKCSLNFIHILSNYCVFSFTICSIFQWLSSMCTWLMRSYVMFVLFTRLS